MTAAELLNEIDSRGISVVAEGERLRLRPRSALTRALVSELKANKNQVLALLRSRASVADAVPGGVEPKQWPLTQGELLEMRLSDFARASLIVRVFSHVLNETVVLASDNAVVDPGEHHVVYRAVELRELLGLRPEDLCAVHEVKRVFGGTIWPS